MKLQEKKLIKISEDTWYYKIDCFYGILYSSKINNQIVYNADIFAKSMNIESCSCPTFDEARCMLEEGVRAWSEISGT